MPGDAAVVEEGLFRGESLYVRFAFPHADYIDALKRYSDAGGNGPARRFNSKLGPIRSAAGRCL